MEVEVRNIREYTKRRGEHTIRVDRSDKVYGLGNPFRIGPRATRSQVIEAYRDLMTKEWMQDKVDQLYLDYKHVEKLVLLCWCYPQPCHADIIKEELLKRINQERKG